MSYLQLEIGGQLRGLKFNTHAYVNFYKEVDMDDYEGTFHYAAVWAALKANAYVKRVEFTEKYETVCDWVDVMSLEDKEQVKDAFANSATYKNLVKDGKQEDDKEPAKKKILKSTTMTV